MSDIFKHELLNKQQSMNKQQRLALCVSVKHSSIVRDLLTCHNNLSENHNRGQRSCCCCCGRTKVQKLVLKNMKTCWYHCILSFLELHEVFPLVPNQKSLMPSLRTVMGAFLAFCSGLQLILTCTCLQRSVWCFLICAVWVLQPG